MNIKLDNLDFSDIGKLIKSIGLTCSFTIDENGEINGNCEKINNSVKEDNDNFDIDPTIHGKRFDLVGKRTNIYPKKGILPSGHRGDLIKIRNGHGRYVPFNNNEF